MSLPNISPAPVTEAACGVHSTTVPIELTIALPRKTVSPRAYRVTWNIIAARKPARKFRNNPHFTRRCHSWCNSSEVATRIGETGISGLLWRFIENAFQCWNKVDNRGQHLSCDRRVKSCQSTQATKANDQTGAFFFMAFDCPTEEAGQAKAERRRKPNGNNEVGQRPVLVRLGVEPSPTRTR